MTGADPEVTEDGLLGGRVRLLQPVEGYRAAIDPVLLAAAVDPAGGGDILELGCGSGAASLCLLHRCPTVRVTGLEIDSATARLARRSAELNGADARFEVVEGDLLAPPMALAGPRFDQVMLNPPFHRADSAAASPNPDRARAHREAGTSLADWLSAALAAVKPKGRVTVIHRADRLAELLTLLAGRAGEAVVFPLWPAEGKPAKRVLLRARAGVATPMTLAAGLVLHEPGGGYTPEAEAILRRGDPLARF